MGEKIEVQVRIQDGPPGSGREAGQLVVVKQQPCVWGREEGPPMYSIVEIELDDGVTFEDWKTQYFKRHHVEVDTQTKEEKFRTRSAFKVDIEKLPAAIKDDLPKPGVTKTKQADLTSRMVDRVAELRVSHV